MPAGKKVYFDRTSMQFVGLDPAKVQQLCDMFPGVNVELELKKMILWLCESPIGMKRIGNSSFIANWLNKAHRTLPVDEVPEPKDPESTLGKAEDAYMEQFWKGKEHLLAMNKLKR